VTVSAWLLASTRRLRVGSGVLVAPLHHPVRLAEQAALLQQASGGRLLLGVGAGYQPADFELFGEDLSNRKRATEAFLRRLSAAWRGEPVVASRRVVPGLGEYAPPEAARVDRPRRAGAGVRCGAHGPAPRLACRRMRRRWTRARSTRRRRIRRAGGTS
jgi:alkanesulfonate monooxygenase SsuD/methylene tetrahydromethanopterin reductase-like flavin-dependent oxidoreductase (luciferase family)